MSIRSPIDNDSRLPQHWSSIDNEMDKRLDAVGKVQDGRYVQHLSDEAKQAAKKKFIDNVKKVFIAQAEVLHGSAHDSKHPMLVNYAMSRLRGDENSFLDKALPAKAMPADDTKQLLQSFQDGIADATAADEHEASIDSSGQHSLAADTRQQSYAAAGMASSTKHYYDSASMLKNTQMSVDTAVSKLSFKTMSRAAFLGAQSAVQSMHSSTMPYAAELNQNSTKNNAVQKKLSAKAQFNQTLNMLPQNVRQSKLIVKYGFSMFGGMDSMQILAAVKTLSALDRMTAMGADIASKQSDDDRKRLKSMDVQLDGMLTAAKIYRRDKGIIGKLKRALQDTVIGKIQSFITDAFGGIFKVFEDIKSFIVDRFFGTAKKKIIDYFSKAFRALGKVISKTVKLFAKFVDITARWIGDAIKRIVGLIYKVCVAAVKMLGSWGGRALAAAKRWTASALKRMKDAFKASRLGRWLARAKTAISIFTKTRVLQPIARFFGHVMKPFKAVGNAIGAAWRASKSFVSRAYAATAKHIASWGRSFAQFAGNIVRHIHLSPTGGWMSLLSRTIMKCPVIGTILRYTGKAIYYLIANKVTKSLWRFIAKRIWPKLAKKFAFSGAAHAAANINIPLQIVLAVIDIMWMISDVFEVLHFMFPKVEWIANVHGAFEWFSNELLNLQRAMWIAKKHEDILARSMAEDGSFIGLTKAIVGWTSPDIINKLKHMPEGLSILEKMSYAAKVVGPEILVGPAALRLTGDSPKYQAFRRAYDAQVEQHPRILRELSGNLNRSFNKLSYSEKTAAYSKRLQQAQHMLDQWQKYYDYEAQLDDELMTATPDTLKVDEILQGMLDAQRDIIASGCIAGLFGRQCEQGYLLKLEDRLSQKHTAEPDIRKAQLDEEELRKHAEESRKISEEWKNLADGLVKDLKAKSRECLIDLQSISGKLNEPDSIMPGADSLFDRSDVLLLVQ